MTLIERARSGRPITWLTIIGVLLLPVVIGGLLVAALHNPTQSLDRMTAAVVNLDEPVTIDGQYTPLGRELTAGLVEGSDDLDSNLTWVISNEEDAAEGLGDGTYQAVVTIPKEFSADATSGAQAIAGGDGEAEQAQIQVTTPPDARVADDLITSQIAQVAASSMGSMLSEATLDNVLVGFSTIGDQLGDAADGADKLADGAKDAADGAAELPDGATALADGAGELASGASQLGDGAGEVATGANSLAGGLDQLATGAHDAASGAAELGKGLTDGAAALEKQGIVPPQLTQAADGAAKAAAGTAQAATGVQSGVDTFTTNLTALAGACDGSAEFCAQLSALADGTSDLKSGAATAAELAQTTSAAASGTATGLDALATQAPAKIAGQLRDAGTGATELSAGISQIAGGIDQSATGARGLSDGATRIATGNRELATGATALGDGATQLADGTVKLGDGLDQLADGTGELADGLHTASTSLPSFGESESTSISSVVSDPVKADVANSSLFGATAIPLLVAIVLWFGSLATYVVMRSMPERVLTSRRSSISLALRGFWPAAVIGAVQGFAVALIVQFVAEYDASTWWSFAGIAVLAGISFAAVNQALVALFGGVGRWISALVGVLAVATGLVSTVPSWLASLGAAMPTAPALSGLIDATGAAAAGLVVWAVLSLLATTLSVAVRRTTSARAVLATAAA